MLMAPFTFQAVILIIVSIPAGLEELFSLPGIRGRNLSGVTINGVEAWPND